ncbi:pre-rRNA-processing protein TSR1 homolog [Halichondria panicea]|uniref:pre-rRNA-processing protein TSR1 homolog n=1 Tax=Halichondria panicea TaxID=6063 RepID=UPI00312B5190
MSTPSEPHRSGPLKQRNKGHKNGRHKSKGEMTALDKGRVGVKTLSGVRRKEARKVDKKNKLRQLRTHKRDQVLAHKRCIGVEGQPPHLVVLIPVSSDVQQVFTMLTGCHDNTMATIAVPELRERFTISYPPTSNLYTLLDLVKVADTAVLVYDMREGGFNASLLDTVCAQGLPTTLHLAVGWEELGSKALSLARKSLLKNIHSRFPGEKLHLFNQQIRPQLLRTLSNQKRRSVFTRDTHPHLLVERSEFIASEGTLKVWGYMRGKPLDIHSVVYIPDKGEYLLKQIDGPSDPCTLKTSTSMQVDQSAVLLLADPSQQSLDREVTLDPMEGDQTWPTDEELAAAAGSPDGRGQRKLPRGMSDYQASWIVDSDLSDNADSGDEWEDPPVSCDSIDDDNDMSIGDLESTADDEDGESYDLKIDLSAEQRELEALRAEREALMFPDEVDTPQDKPAKERFQKYRGLRSFRSSPWDKLENLPRDYARIFQFERFGMSRKRALCSLEEANGALPGWYVTLHIANYPQDASPPSLVYGLLPHEHKMSVVHFAVKKSPGYSQPIKSKERLVFHCGVRRFSAAPIFSEHTPGDKHKYERYMANSGVCMASVFAPVSYPPQPVLLFKHQEGGEAVLVGSGGVVGVNPSRVIVKRVILSGHPYKINKRSAVIRYMFFNRDDIDWFKPVELRTKLGRRGHIKEPLGTHGHMKCVFDGQLKAQDTILMNLYKRVYPKWTYEEPVTTPTNWTLYPEP